MALIAQYLSTRSVRHLQDYGKKVVLHLNTWDLSLIQKIRTPAHYSKNVSFISILTRTTSKLKQMKIKHIENDIFLPLKSIPSLRNYTLYCSRKYKIEIEKKVFIATSSFLTSPSDHHEVSF